jgi:uncharacterized membrane protein YdjX (TVP38/TMEM64 family)
MRRLLVTVALVGLAVVAVLAVGPLREAVGHALHGDIHLLRSELRGLGVVGAIVLVGLILTHAVVFFPAEIPNATAGLVFGFAVGLPLVVVAWLASGLIAYWLGVVAGRPLAIRLAGEHRVAIAERVIDRGGAPALLLARLIPFVPYSLVGYIAGATRVPLWRYAWTSVLGSLPMTAAATYLGHALDDLSASDPLVWTVLAVVTVLAASTPLLARRVRRERR